MKHEYHKNKGKKNVVSKGDRLNWTSLAETRPVVLTHELVRGKQLTSQDLEERANFTTASNNVLVP